MKKLTPCKLKEIVHEEVSKLHEEIGWENLPDGWDEESVESFAKSLTGKDKDDTEGFWTKCYERIKDEEGFDEEGAKAFCASLKDEYLGTTDWRGESVKRNDNSMKLTESQLRDIIREELSMITEYDDGFTKLGTLQDNYPDGTLINNQRMVKDTAQLLVDEGIINEKQARNYKAFFWTGAPLIGGVDERTNIWASYKEPYGSMSPTESVNFMKINP